ncbi:MAG: ligase-associated DNA damage response endonuclease PdeM [Ginsengibacter sp.]
MFSPVKFILQKQTLWLSPARCIFWEEEKALILSDLHFGKSGHFRKSGIGVPQNIYKEDLQRLFTQIQFFKPSMLLIAGDMFHSNANKEIDFFVKWRKDVPGVRFHLIKGNHDLLSKKFYEKSGIDVSLQKMSIGNFCFTHDIDSVCDDEGEKLFTFSGHIHPGIKVNGLGKQSLSLPCFYFSKEYAVLPAFSMFTGLFNLRPKKSDTVFALVNGQVIKMQ